MENLLSPIQRSITQELITLALSNSSASFSKMAGEHVEIDDCQIKEFGTEDLTKILTNDSGNINILSTEIIGDLQGKTFLLFNEENTKKVVKIFTNKDVADSNKLNELETAVLLELDNIITAAMVTQLSNILEIKAYGDVPNIKNHNLSESLAYFSKEVKHYDIILKVKAKFHSEKSNISPIFLCFFKNEFIQAIKAIASNPEKIKTFKSIS
jgi:chemotaxis protein CheY-P-specific phosphatase CheC